MLRFAPRFGMISPCLHWRLHWGAAPRTPLRLRQPANDNGAALLQGRAKANDDAPLAHDEALLEAALRLFAAHGLSAAVRACEAAEIAAKGGDTAGAEWWLAVCATFDSTLARAASQAFEGRHKRGA